MSYFSSCIGVYLCLRIHTFLFYNRNIYIMFYNNWSLFFSLVCCVIANFFHSVLQLALFQFMTVILRLRGCRISVERAIHFLCKLPNSFHCDMEKTEWHAENSFVTFHTWCDYQLTRWLAVWVHNWLMSDWMADWLTNWRPLAVWVTDSITDYLARWLTDPPINRLVGWLNDWLTEWLINYLADIIWITDRLTGWLNDGLTDWLADLLND
jgi:hypothetical protein